MQIRTLGQEDPLEEGVATHSSILAWRIPQTEEPGGLQAMGWQRVGHDRCDLAHMHTHDPGKGTLTFLTLGIVTWKIWLIIVPNSQSVCGD